MATMVMPWWWAMNGSTTAATLAFRDPRWREVERLVEAVAAARARQPSAVRNSAAAACGIDHRGQRRGVGRDDSVVGQTALQAEAGDAEVGILIGELEVAGVEGRLRDAPGRAELRAVFDLPLDDQPVGLLDAGCPPAPASPARHQVFEHRARPGDQRRAVVDGRHRPAQPEPVARRRVALGDGDEAGQPRLRGQQVVAARDRGRPRWSGSRSTAAAGPGRAGTRSPSPSPWRAPYRAEPPQPSRKVGTRIADRSGGFRWSRRRRESRRASPARRSRLPRSRSPGRHPATRAISTPRLRQRPAPPSATLALSTAISEARRRRGSEGRRAVSGASPSVLGQGRARRERPASRVASASAACRQSRQASARAIRCPARLPLSTEETYCGSSGRRSLDVVPVEEVAAVARQRADGRQRRLQAFDRVDVADPAEVARAGARTSR